MLFCIKEALLNAFLVKNLMTPVILDVEFLICGVLRSEARYVAHADGF